MSPGKKSEMPSIPGDSSMYKDNTTQKEKETVSSLHDEFYSKNSQIPPLSQSEQEHLTYLAVLGEYNIAKRRRTNYRKYGALAIIISGIIFLALIFSLEAKIEFLCLWIITIIWCVAVMIGAEYNYHKLKEFLGIADEFDYFEISEDDEEPDTVQDSPPPVTIPEEKKTENTKKKEAGSK